MAANGGRHQLGPESGRLTLRTYRSGLAAQAGHDLTIDVTRWRADIDPPARNFTADAPAVPNAATAPSTLDATIDLTSLAIREGRGGLMPLTDRDRRDILGQARKQLDTGHYPEASYSATTFTPDASGGGAIDGTLTLHGQSRPLRLQVARTGDGQYRASGTVVQTQFGIKPYSGMFGALKLRDDVEIEITVTLPAPGSPSAPGGPS
jgi:polyisoprenoid-binding protein YceI